MIIKRLCHRTPLHGYLLISNLVYLAAVRASYPQDFRDQPYLSGCGGHRQIDVNNKANLLRVGLLSVTHTLCVDQYGPRVVEPTDTGR